MSRTEGEICELLSAIKSKQLSASDRVFQCQQLTHLLSSLQNIEEIGMEWSELAQEVLVVLQNKNAFMSLKKASIAVLPPIGGLLWNQFNQYVLFMVDFFKSLHIRAEEERAMVILAIGEGMSVALSRGFHLSETSVSCLMGALVEILDTNNAPQVLSPILELCQKVAVTYPVIFAPYFQEVVDITVGWYVEGGSTMDTCADLLRGLRPFWVSEYSYAITLMENFLADVANFTSTYLTARNGKRSAVLDSRARPVLGALRVVLEQFETADTYLPGNALNPIDKFGLEIQAECYKCLNNLRECRTPVVCDFLASFCSLFLVIARRRVHDDNLEGRDVSACDVALHILDKCFMTPSAVVVIVDFFAKVFTLKLPMCESSTGLELVKKLIGSEGILRRLNLISKVSVAKEYCNLLTAVLRPTSLANLQYSYEIVRNEVIEGVTILQSATDCTQRISQVCRRSLEARVIVHVSSLRHIAVIKNSLIVMMGLRPSLFTLLADEVFIHSTRLHVDCPFAFTALITLFNKHCATHDYFLANAEWSQGGRSSVLGESTTSKYAARQIEILGALLRQQTLKKSNRKLLTGWLRGLISCLDPLVLQRILNRKEWIELIRVVRECVIEGLADEDLTWVSDTLKLMTALTKSEAISTVDRVVAKIRNGSSLEVYGDGAKLWEALDGKLLLRVSVLPYGLENRSSMVQQRVSQTAAFSVEDFSLLVNFLIYRTLPSYQRHTKTDHSWLMDTIEMMYNECLSENQLGGTLMQKGKKADVMQKWSWALVHLANYCIENRMRTPLGKPMDTFDKFRSEIRRLAKEASGEGSASSAASKEISESEVRKGLMAGATFRRRAGGDRADDDDDQDDYGEARSLTKAEEWWRVRCLLDFVDLLDKLIYNVQSGAVFTVATPSHLARQFFLTNAAPCQDWLQRTYGPAMVVAYHNSYYPMVLRFGAVLLHDCEKRHRGETSREGKKEGSPEPKMQQLPDYVLPVLGWMARAMCAMNAEQAMCGLLAWTQRVYGVSPTWLQGAVHMAAARYETSLAGFAECLKDSDLSDNTKKVVREMVLEVCCRLRFRPMFEPQGPEDLALFQDGDTPTALAKEFDQDALLRMQQLSTFKHLDGGVRLGEGAVSWDLERTMYGHELRLTQTMRRSDVANIRTELSTMARTVLLSNAGHRLHTRITTVAHLAASVMMKMDKTNDAHDKSLTLQSLLSPEFLLEEGEGELGERLTVARQLTVWAERFGATSHGPGVYLAMARLARKTGNPHLTEYSLQKAANLTRSSDVFHHITMAIQNGKMIMSSGTDARQKMAFVNMFGGLARAFDMEEQRKLIIYPDQQQLGGAMNGLTNGHGVVNEFIPHAEIAPASPELSELMSRGCLRLAEFIDHRPELVAELPPEARGSAIWGRIELAMTELGVDTVGGLLAMAAQTAPQLAKAHLRMADWCYTAAEFGEKERNRFDMDYRVLLGSSVTPETLDGVWQALTSSSSLAKLEGSITQTLAGDHSSIKTLMQPNSHLMNLWGQLRRRRQTFQQYSVESYFSFIHAAGGRDGQVKATIGSVRATLRILGLLVRHSDHLHEVISLGLANTNELLWKDVLPQLFARLSHPVKEVRDLVVGLLCRLCRSAPHALVFHVVAGVSAAMLVEADDVIDADQDEPHKTANDRSKMWECCRELEGVLEASYPSLVRDVRLFVSELQRINLLNEEKWVFVLSNLDHEMDKRISQIRSETDRTMQSSRLDDVSKEQIVADKARLITAQVFRLLEDLRERTVLSTPGTENERHFIEIYGDHIRHAFDQSRSHRNHIEKSWMPFKQLLAVFIQRTSRRGGQHLSMPDISLGLATLSKSCVPIPGQEEVDYSQVVSVERVVRNVLVLPTKTRPKKMAFIGSDGKEHMFLFKAQEDLHLDERIMQLLHICNLMLQSGSSKRAYPEYSAKHYAVTPLGTRSGLIQWVGGATPLFHIYRKWQIRQAQFKQAASGEKRLPTIAAEQVDRPTDLYQKKLRQLFAANTIEPAVIADRSRWPPELLKELLLSLMKDTPKDLLSRELWMRAGSGDTWWQVVSRLARSSSVMSMIGAILGLGDRHLDNVLVNLESGHVVHIDYNICFDKGRNLRVPETVPFRMTQNLVHAMGPTQLQGVFRESSIQVIRVLREGSEVLLTMLDAFVFDPLVDWAQADPLAAASSAAVSVAVVLAVYGTDSRSVGARPMAREMFSVRIREHKAAWMENCSCVVSSLNSVVSVLERHRVPDQSVWNTADLVDVERVEAGRRLKTCIGQHQLLMKDFRPLVRALATCDERFSSYLRAYRALFHDPLVKGNQLLDGSQSELTTCIGLFQSVLDNIQRIYYDLLELDQKDSPPRSPPHNAQDPLPLTRVAPPPGLDEETNKQQEQNAHARAVVRRVRARLEGRHDSSDNKRVITVNEQTDHLIRQATSISQLALMYEGWTAWV